MSFAAIGAYERWLTRAKAVVSGAPFWKSIDNEDFARLEVDGRQATLWWLDISSGYYGSWETDSLSVSFDASLLTMPEKDFVAWKAEERAKYDVHAEAERRVALERREAQERASYEALKRKFG